MPGVRRSTGEQEAPEEQQEEFQVLWEVGEHPQGSQDSWAHLQAGLCSCWHRGELLGWIPSAGVLWEAQAGGTDGAHLGRVRSQRRDEGSGRAGPGDIAEPPGQQQEQHSRGITGTPGCTWRWPTGTWMHGAHRERAGMPGRDRGHSCTPTFPNPGPWRGGSNPSTAPGQSSQQVKEHSRRFQQVQVGQFQVMEEPTRR